MKDLNSGIRFFILIPIGLAAVLLCRGPVRSQEESAAVWLGHENGVTGVAFFPGGDTVASCGLDGTIRLWDSRSGQIRKNVRSVAGELYSLAVSRDGQKIVAVGSGGLVDVVSADGKRLRICTGIKGWSTGIALSPDSRFAAVWSMDGDIWFWDIGTGEHVRSLEGQKNQWGMALAWSPDGSLFAAGRLSVSLWDTKSGKIVRTLEGHTDFVADIEFSRDGRHLGSASWDKTIRVWDLGTGKASKVFNPEGFVMRVESGLVTQPIRLPATAVAFSPDGSVLATGGADRVVRLWDLGGGRLLREFKGHRMSVTSLAFSPDGARLASASLDHTIRLWNVR